MKKCELCERDRFEISQTCIPFLKKDGISFYCVECGLSILSQVFEFTEKDIDNYLDFLFKGDGKNKWNLMKFTKK